MNKQELEEIREGVLDIICQSCIEKLTITGCTRRRECIWANYSVAQILAYLSDKVLVEVEGELPPPPFIAGDYPEYEQGLLAGFALRDKQYHGYHKVTTLKEWMEV